MRYRLLFIIGLLAGYVLGARAGRDRFDQIAEAASDALDDPRVKKAVDAVTPDVLKPDTQEPDTAPAAPVPSPAPKPAPPVAAPVSELPTVSTEEPLTAPVEDVLDEATIEALEALAEGDALREDEARAHRDD